MKAAMYPNHAIGSTPIHTGQLGLAPDGCSLVFMGISLLFAVNIYS